MNRQEDKYFYVYNPSVKAFTKVKFRPTPQPPALAIDKSGLSKLTMDDEEESLGDLQEMEFIPFQIRINKWSVFYLFFYLSCPWLEWRMDQLIQ